jgi:hypothetical protein
MMEAVFVEDDEAGPAHGLFIDIFVIRVITLMIDAEIERSRRVESIKAGCLIDVIIFAAGIRLGLDRLFDEDCNLRPRARYGSNSAL